MAAGSKEMRNPATRLPDDLIVKILSRLPIKSLCRSKCVSKHWRGLISHPDHRKKLPQTLAGFFYHNTNHEGFPESIRYFTNVTGRGEPLIRSSLSFLPGYAEIDILDSCNGLLLCRSWMAAGAVRYVVCNPATKEWAALPESSHAGNICNARLGFDPAVSPHFHVFEFVERDVGPVDDYTINYVFVNRLEIYSSKTGEWAFSGSRWSDCVCYGRGLLSTVFLNGSLHVLQLVGVAVQNVVVIDTEGEAPWRTIPLPWLDTYYGDTAFIGQSQGHLYYLNTEEEFADVDSGYLEFTLKVFVLEHYASDNWVLKHSVSTSKFVGMNSDPKHSIDHPIAIHSECHLIFFVSDLDHTIRCYDMDSRKVCVIHNMECERGWRKRCLPYVPIFSESSVAWN